MPEHSHVSVRVVIRPNANTRVVDLSPRIDAASLDEAYQRALTLQAPPMAAPGYRLFWFRGSNIGHFDLAADPNAFAVVGRHTHCDVVFPLDPAIALRHALLRVYRLPDGVVALRVLDLRTALGFYLDDDEPRRAVMGTGPFALRLGRYVLVALPSGVALPAERPPVELIDAPRAPLRAPPEAGSTRITTLPGAPFLQEIPPPASSGHGRITLRRDEAFATVDLDESALETGTVLIGRSAGMRGGLARSTHRQHFACSHADLARNRRNARLRLGVNAGDLGRRGAGAPGSAWRTAGAHCASRRGSRLSWIGTRTWSNQSRSALWRGIRPIPRLEELYSPPLHHGQ